MYTDRTIWKYIDRMQDRKIDRQKGWNIASSIDKKIDK